MILVLIVYLGDHFTAEMNISLKNMMESMHPYLRLQLAVVINRLKFGSSKLIQILLNCSLKKKDLSDWIRDIAWCPSVGAPSEILVSCNEDGSVQWWKNSKNNERDFKEFHKVQCEGPAWRLRWSFAGNLLAISSAGSNSENIVEVYKENEQGKWEKISKIDDDTVAPDS